VRQSMYPELVTFQGCEDLLRGSPLTTVLRRQGTIFRTSVGSASTYALSAKVGRIDAFISHNWSVARYLKFLSLADHFSFDIAASCTMALTWC